MVDVAVIVPVLGRPEHAARFVESFTANTPPDRAVVLPVTAMDDPVDGETWRATMRAWRDAGVPPIAMRVGHGFSFAKKVNAAYELNDEPWLLLVGSDVVFHPGWLENALLTAQISGASLVATNDLHNPAVLAGAHATHPLIARSYIDEVGASWDGPGVVCHEGYQHCWVDNELSTAARNRGVFAYSPLSIIEHRHPLWGGAEDDATYQLGQSTYAKDQALFMERLAKYGKGR